MAEEMAESLIYSWLRHVKKCQLVQTNWKASSTLQPLHLDELEKMKEEVDKYYSKKYGHTDIFKKNSGVEQLLSQGECDAIGFRMGINGENTIYAVESAFHSDGLNYSSGSAGGKNRIIYNAEQVLKKCVRNAACIYSFFDLKSGVIIFSSPYVRDNVNTHVKELVGELNQVINDLGYDFKFMFISNDEYKKEIFDPVIEVCEKVNDNSDMFLRSIRLEKLLEKEKYKK